MSGPWDERRAAAEQEHLDDPALGGGGPSPFLLWALPHLRTHVTGGDLIELGAGSGRDAHRWATEGFRVRTVDFAPSAVERADARRRALGEPYRSRWRVVDAEAGRFLRSVPPSSVDAVVAHLVYGGFNADELAVAWAEIYRILRPGGVHAYAVSTPRSPRSTGSDDPPSASEDGETTPGRERSFRIADLEALDAGRFAEVAHSVRSDLHQIYRVTRCVRPPPRPPGVAGVGPRDHSVGF